MTDCKNDRECTHWVYLKKEKGSYWECRGLKDATVAYEPMDSDEWWNTKESECGYIPSRAPLQKN